jgi:hypothetical protein
MKMPNDFYVLTFIEALNSAFPIWADQWRHAARDTTKPITLTMLYNDATDEARDRNLVAKETNVSLYANNPKGGRGSNHSSNSSKREKCGHCNKPGYKEEDCFIKFPAKKEVYNAKKAER